MKIGFIGSQTGITQFQQDGLIETLKHFQCTEFCHGDMKIPDKQANQLALDIGIKIYTIFPPLEGKKRAWCFNEDHQRFDSSWHLFNGINVRWMPPDAYLVQHKHIVDNVDQMIACPKEFEHSIKSGTWAVIRYAWKTKRAITIIPPVIREESV